MPDPVVFFHTVATLAPFLEEKYRSKIGDENAPVEHAAHPELLEALSTDKPREEIYADFVKALQPHIKGGKQVLVTCSSLGDMVERFTEENPQARLHRIDRPMMQKAAASGHQNIALVVTNDMTVEPSTNALRAACFDDVRITCIDCRNEMADLNQQAVQERVLEMLKGYDAVILAQVSIGKAFEDAGLSCPAILYKSYEDGFAPLLEV